MPRNRIQAGGPAAGTARTISTRSRRPGVTRTEVTLIVACLSVLMLTMAAAPGRGRDESKWVTCINHLRTMGQAAGNFADQHDGSLQLVANRSGVATADPKRRKFAYAGGELLAWPVALAQAAGAPFTYNWDWGVRADDFEEAVARQARMSDAFQAATCPSDTTQIATPFYPRGNLELVGPGDPEYPVTPGPSTAYWGHLSYALNEDICGVDSTPRQPSCGRFERFYVGGYTFYSWLPGEMNPHAGWRLRGRLADVADPATVGLLFESPFGPRTSPFEAASINLVNTSRVTIGPYLGDAQLTWPGRIARNRHARGRLNVLFADFHADAVRPIKYRDRTIPGGSPIKLPSEYAPPVRVSPYPLPDVQSASNSGE